LPAAQFSFPGGILSHGSLECPGSIHEGGELSYSLSHSFGEVFDNPNLVVAYPATDGAVLPQLFRSVHVRLQFKERKLCRTGSSAGDNHGLPLYRTPTF
jgi:phosphoketolase